MTIKFSPKAPPAPVVSRKPRRLGDFFREITKRSITDVATVDDVDTAVAAALHQPNLEFAEPNNRLGMRNGDVFQHMSSPSTKVNARIDSLLEKAN